MASLNETSLLDGGGKLRSILTSIRLRFFTVEEFPFLDRTVLPQGALDNAMNIRSIELESFAFGLQGKDLEGLLLDLIFEADPERINKAIQILKIRFSSRITKLLSILYQFNENSEGLNQCLREFSMILSHRSARSPEETFIKQFGMIENKVKAVCDAIDDLRWNISECLKDYAINGKSPFAVNCVLTYLNTASRPALLLNRSWILRCFEDIPTIRLNALIENYLSTFSLKEYHDGINLAILNKLGIPYISTDWDFYPQELKKKFAQWYFLHQLRVHTIDVPKKYKVLSKYVDRVRTSYQTEIEDEKLFVIDFGEIVIADIEMRQYSFFYHKDEFEAEMAAWKENKEMLPTFIRMDKKNLTARDFIIEEVEEPCVKLSYEGIDILYIQEMIDIKMGIEPDMRRKQLAKTFKKEGIIRVQNHSKER